jgi:hypothetical protein
MWHAAISIADIKNTGMKVIEIKRRRKQRKEEEEAGEEHNADFITGFGYKYTKYL